MVSSVCHVIGVWVQGQKLEHRCANGPDVGMRGQWVMIFVGIVVMFLLLRKRSATSVPVGFQHSPAQGSLTSRRPGSRTG